MSIYNVELTSLNRVQYAKMCFLIADMTLEERALVVNEVLMLTPMLAWNINTKSLEKIESVSVNGECIQLNIEELGDE